MALVSASTERINLCGPTDPSSSRSTSEATSSANVSCAADPPYRNVQFSTSPIPNGDVEVQVWLALWFSLFELYSVLPADIQENEIINSVKLDGRSLSFLNKPSLLSWKYFDYSLTLCISYILFYFTVFGDAKKWRVSATVSSPIWGSEW